MLTAVDFYPPQYARFFAFSPGNVHFKKSVKYNLMSAINDKGRRAGAAPEGAVLEIAAQEQNLSPIKAFIKELSPKLGA